MTRRVLTIVALLAVAYSFRLWVTRDLNMPPAPNLEEIPRQLGNWHVVHEGLSSESASILRADSVLMRDYELSPGAQIRLFIAYYRTQRAGESMHSPRNCLPGSGWQPTSRSYFNADMGQGRMAGVNRYVIEKDGDRMLVVYWYQEHERIIANEYSGKLYLMWDAIRRHQRDGAIVRLSVPLRGGLSEEQALEQTKQFVGFAAPEITNVLFRTRAETR